MRFVSLPFSSQITSTIFHTTEIRSPCCEDVGEWGQSFQAITHSAYADCYRLPMCANPGSDANVDFPFACSNNWFKKSLLISIIVINKQNMNLINYTKGVSYNL